MKTLLTAFFLSTGLFLAGCDNNAATPPANPASPPPADSTDRDTRDVGREVGETTREIGREAKELGQEITQEAKEFGQGVKEGFNRGDTNDTAPK